MTLRSVPRRSRAGSSEIPLFLAFPDGAFHYVCAECTALCCRGHGFGGNLRREMQAVLALHPSLGRAATSRHGGVVLFHNPQPQCYFLDPDNLCRIEKQHGRALKPGICALFPFNVFTRIGRTVAVSPHFLCPLRLQAPPRPGEVTGTHAVVEAAVRESGLLDREYLESRPRAQLHDSQDARAVLKREEGFRELCARSLGRRSFFETLREASADAGGFAFRVARAQRVLGLEPVTGRRERDRLDDVLLALASPLRLSMLSLRGEAILSALALGEGIARQVLSLTAGEPTLQVVRRAVASAAPALRLLALGEEPLPIPEGAVKVASLGSPELTLAAYVALRRGRGPAGTIAALETAIKASMSVADRSVILDYLGNEVARAEAAHAKSRRRAKGQGVASRPQ